MRTTKQGKKPTERPSAGRPRKRRQWRAQATTPLGGGSAAAEVGSDEEAPAADPPHEGQVAGADKEEAPAADPRPGGQAAGEHSPASGAAVNILFGQVSTPVGCPPLSGSRPNQRSPFSFGNNLLPSLTPAWPASVSPSTAALARPASASPSTAPLARPASVSPSTAALARPASVSPSTAASARPASVSPSTAASARPASVSPSTAASARPASASPSTAPSARPASVSPSTDPSARPASASPSTDPSARPASASPSTDPSARPTSASPATAAFARPASTSPSTDPSARASRRNQIPSPPSSGNIPSAAISRARKDTASSPITTPTAPPKRASPANQSPNPTRPPSPTGRKSRLRQRRSKSPKNRRSEDTSKTGSPSSAKSKHPNISRLFTQYLEQNGSKLVDNMWNDGSFTLKLEFWDIRMFSKELAFSICNISSESLYKAICGAARDYALKAFKMKNAAEKSKDDTQLQCEFINKFKLLIAGLPRRIDSLESIIKQVSNSSLRELFRTHRNRHQVAPMNEGQRSLLITCLEKLVNSHTSGYSWNGQLGLGDWDWVNGSHPVISSPSMNDPKLGAEHLASCKADLKRFATELIVKFKTNGRFPAYLQHLHLELNYLLENIPSDVFFGWYKDYLLFHPCLLPSRARLMLILGWFHAIAYLGYEEWPAYKKTIGSLWEWTDIVHDHDEVDIHKIVWDVFWNKSPPAKGLDRSKWKRPYKNTYAQNHRYLRQLCAHAYRSTQHYRGFQSADEVDEPELFAADMLPLFLPEFIKHLFKSGRVTCEFWEFLRMAWRLR